MQKTKTYNIKDINIAHTMIDTNIYIEATNYRGTITLLQNTNKYLECNNKKYITIAKELNTNKYIYIDRFNNFSYDSEDLIYQIAPYYIESNIKLNELLEKFNKDKRNNSKYRDHILPLVKKLKTKLENKETITNKELENIINEVTEIYAYLFKIITEEEFELLTEDQQEGPKVLDIKNYQRRK